MSKSKLATYYHRLRYRWYQKTFDLENKPLVALCQLLRFIDAIDFVDLDYRKRVGYSFDTHTNRLDELIEYTDQAKRAIEHVFVNLNRLPIQQEPVKRMDLDRYMVNADNYPVYETELERILKHHLRPMVQALDNLSRNDSVRYNFFSRSTHRVLCDWHRFLTAMVHAQLGLDYGKRKRQ